MTRRVGMLVREVANLIAGIIREAGLLLTLVKDTYTQRALIT